MFCRGAGFKYGRKQKMLPHRFSRWGLGYASTFFIRLLHRRCSFSRSLRCMYLNSRMSSLYRSVRWLESFCGDAISKHFLQVQHFLIKMHPADSTGCICLHNLHCRWRNRFPSPPLGLVESVRTKGCAGSFNLVSVVLPCCREFHFFPSEACPRNVCTCRCFQIALGVCLIGMQREGNIRRKGFTCKQIYIYFCDNRA